MNPIIDTMRTRLRTDATMMSYLPGGIFDRPLDPDDPLTAAAWVINPDTQVPHLAPCGVLLDPQEVDSPTGYRVERHVAYDMWPDLYLYAEEGDAEAVFLLADKRARTLLHGYVTGTATIEATPHRGAPLIADELPGVVWSVYRRFRVQDVSHV